MDITNVMKREIPFIPLTAEVYKHSEKEDIIYQVYVEFIGQVYGIEIIIADKGSNTTIEEEVDKIRNS